MKAGSQQFRRGISLVATMWILIVLTGLVLSMSYSVRLEAMASANRAAIAAAESAERGAEQYLIAAVDAELYSFGTMKDISFEARQIGDCYVWFINSVPGSNTLTFSPIDEGGKFNLNLIAMTAASGANKTTFHDMLAALPGMTDEQASCIIDWRDNDSTAYGGNGAEDTYYTGLSPSYKCKNGDFESLEELLLVKGFDVSTLWGSDTNRNGIIDEGETSGNDDTHGLGLAPYITTFGVATANARQPNGTRPTATIKINLNSAPMEVLKAIFAAGSDQSTAEANAKDVVAHRQNTTTSDMNNIRDWLRQSKPQLFNRVQQYVTGQSLVYSADILAVTRDGRAFRRFRVVAQGSATATNVTKIVFRQDITAAGWPLDPQIREDLRRGIEPTSGVRSVNK